MKQRKNILVGITGGIAAYKACDVINRLTKNNFNVDVIMTKNATEFITPLSVETLCKNKVCVNMFKEKEHVEVEHISLAKKADLVLIVPATANIIGKIANGIADDMLSTTVMATKAPVFLAPAMNNQMYENKIVQDNIAKLKKYGYKFINPITGRLACGDNAIGKLKKTDDIVSEIINYLNGDDNNEK